MKKQFILFALFAGIFSLIAQVSVPLPDAAYLFDDANWTTTVTDETGNGNDGFWYNIYIGPDPADPYDAGYDSPLYNAGYHSDAGKFGGAAYLNGYHYCCEQMASASQDIIFLAGNNRANEKSFIDTNSVFQGDKDAFTISLWFKSDRDYSIDEGASGDTWKGVCPEEDHPIGWLEREVIIDGGVSKGGFTIENSLQGYFDVTVVDTNKNKVSITYMTDPDETEPTGKTWYHLALVFDGAAQLVTFYINGEVATSQGGQTNPIATPFSMVQERYTEAAIVVGAENGGSPTPFAVNGSWWTGHKECQRLTGDDTLRVRTGWPTNGYIDDLGWWKNKALSQEQIQKVMNDGLKSVMGGTPVEHQMAKAQFLNVFPNPSAGILNIALEEPAENVELTVYNMMGSVISSKTYTRFTHDILDLSNYSAGAYILKVSTDNEQYSRIINLSGE